MNTVRPHRRRRSIKHQPGGPGTRPMARPLAAPGGLAGWTPIVVIAGSFTATAVALMTQFIGPQSGLLVLSFVHLAFGLLVFALHGGILITPTGLYYLSTALFVGGAGVYVVLLNSVDMNAAHAASLAVFLGNLFLYALRFRRGVIPTDPGQSDAAVSERLASASWRLGMVLLGLALAGNFAGLAALGPIPHALAFSGVVALFAGVALSVASRKRSTLLLIGIAGAGFALFIETFFHGFGRLNVVALLLAGGLVANTVRPRHWHKRLLIILIIPAWIGAGLVGTQRGSASPEETSIQEVFVQGEGLGSGYSGMLTFADLVQLDRDRPQEAYPRRYGMTLVEAVTIPIPRAWWEDKPVGFGFSLTLLLLPENASKGHSMAATAFGEWFVNFWWFGFALMPLILAPSLRSADGWQGKLRRRGIHSTASLMSLLALIIVASSIPNYVWGDLASVMARAGIRLLLIAPIWIGASRLGFSRRSAPMARRS